MEDRVVEISERLARLEANQSNIKDDVKEIKDNVSRILCNCSEESKRLTAIETRSGITGGDWAKAGGMGTLIASILFALWEIVKTKIGG